MPEILDREITDNSTPVMERSIPSTPYVASQEKNLQDQTGREKIVIAGVLALVVLFGLVFFLSSRAKPKQRLQQNARFGIQQQKEGSTQSVTPTDQMAPTKDKQDDTVSASDIDHTKDPTRSIGAMQATSAPNSASRTPGAGGNAGNQGDKPQQLGSIPPFQRPILPNGQQQWAPPPYDSQQGQQVAPQQQSMVSPQDIVRQRKEEVSKPSMVFTHRPQPNNSKSVPTSGPTVTNFGLKLVCFSLSPS